MPPLFQNPTEPARFPQTNPNADMATNSVADTDAAIDAIPRPVFHAEETLERAPENSSSSNPSPPAKAFQNDVSSFNNDAISESGAIPAIRVSDSETDSRNVGDETDALGKKPLSATRDEIAVSKQVKPMANAGGALAGVLLLGGLSAFALMARQTIAPNVQNVASNNASRISSTGNAALSATPEAANSAAPNGSLSSIFDRLQQTQKLMPGAAQSPQTAPSSQGQTNAPANPSGAPQTGTAQNPAPQNGAMPNAPASGSPASGAPALGAPALGAPTSGASNVVEATFNRAVAAQKAGRNDEALAAYGEVLKTRPDLIPARVNMALLLLQMKRPAEALPQLQAARKLDPKNPSLPWQIAQTLVQLKRPAEALEPLRAVVALAPRDPQSRGALAQLLSASGKTSEALAQWKELAALAPQSADAAFNAGSLAASLKRWDEAATWLRRAKTLVDKTDPRDPRPTLQLARVLAQSGKTRDAQDLLENGVTRFPKVVEIGTLLSDVRLERGDKSGAVDALQNVLPQVPANVENGVPRARLYAAIARLQENRKRFGEACDAWASATKLLPRDPDLRAFYADASLKNGDQKTAIAQFRYALQLDAKRNDLRLPLARALANADQNAQANIEYSKLLQVQPKNPALLAEQAQVLEKQKKYGAAIANWQRIELLLPDKSAPILESARVLRAAGRENDALSKYRQTLQLEANQPDALLGAAQLEEKTGQGARALAHWRDLVAARPEYLPAYNALLDNAARRRQTTATVNFLRPILARQPNNPIAFDAVLRAYKTEGTPEVGRVFVQQFIKKYPKALAPQRALTRFDLQNARHRLQGLSSATPSSTRTPDAASSATPKSTPNATPKSTPDATPDATPATTPSATPNHATATP